MTPSPHRPGLWLLSSALTVLLVGCDFPGREDAARSELADAVAILDSPLQASIDTTPLAPLQDSLVADSTTVQADSTDPVLAAVEQLRREVEALRVAQQAAATSSDQDTADTVDGTAADVPAEVLREAREEVGSWGVRFVLAVFVLALVAILIGLVVRTLEALSERTATRRLLLKRLVPIVRIFFWTIAIYFVISVVLGVDAQGLIAAGAAVGVAIGFAAQDILKNVFGGLIVIFDQPFQVGDKIKVGGTYGEVVSIGLRSTKLVTPDDSLVTVPNAQLVDHQVANANAGELDCQVVTDLYLPGDVDEAKVKALARQAAVSSEYVYLKKPVIVLVMDEFKETFLLHVRVKAYVLDSRLEFLFQSDVTERARAAFREAGFLAEDRRFTDWHGTGSADASSSEGSWEHIE